MLLETNREISECVLENGVRFRSVRDPRFKTQKISVHMMVPLAKETAAAYGMLPFLLSRTNRAYPDYTLLGQRMAELYGASLNGEVSKLGDVQVLTISACGIADRYALEGESISAELTSLLCSSITDPVLDEEGLFPEEGFQQEKRQTLELLDSELNDKRVYARRRALELLLGEEPAAIGRYGSRESVEALTREELVSAWKYLLRHAVLEVDVLGDCTPEQVRATVLQYFPKDRTPVECPTVVKPAKGTVKEKTESMEVQQCKLIMGFRTGVSAMEWEKVPAIKMMSTVFGGTPHSRLFLNVREKMSLCYYCASRYDTNKGILLVESGVEEANVEKAREAILQQLEDLRNGNISDDELTFAKLSMANGLHTVEDYLSGTESWYLSQTFHPRTITPEESAREMQQITKEQVAAAARSCILDAVYVMKGGE